MGQDKIPEIFQKAAYKTKAKTIERKTPDKKGVSNGEIAANTIVLLESKKEGADKKWRQLKNSNGTSSAYNGYLHLPDLDAIITCNVKDEDFDTVAQNEIPVKAGTIIGYTGLYETERVTKYFTTHVDIFTCNAQKTKDFIDNTAKNGLHQQIYLRIKEGTELKKAYPPYTIPAGYNIKVLAKGTEYTKIKKHSLSKIVLKSDLSLIQGTGANPEYNPKSLAKLNGDFDGKLKSTSRLILEEKKDEGQGANKIEKRQVRFEFANSPELWVKNSFLGANTEQTGLFTLSTELTEFYYEEPSSTANETMRELQILELPNIYIIQDSNGETWYYITCEDKGENGSKVTRKGWLKSDTSDTKQKISAYDWAEFGFKMIEDDSDEHFYECGESGFIDTLCKEMDTDKSQSLDQRELQQAFKQPFYARKLSRLICYHTSEWSYTKDKLPNIKDTVTKKMDAEIDKETDTVKKERMKTLKTERLNDLETRISDLDFWDKVTQNTTFPAGNPKVYHFHPIAFIDQMKKRIIAGNIDWSFISKCEGGTLLDGYVPHTIEEEEIPVVDAKGKPVMVNGIQKKEKVKKKVAIANSGVTIAAGFDIGAHSTTDIKNLFKTNLVLQNLYLPYADKHKSDAIEYLDKNPLTITETQGNETNQLIHESQKTSVINKYNTFNPLITFDALPTGVQTSVMSICFQYGANSGHFGKMWKALKHYNWEELADFFEAMAVIDYEKRRKSEKKFLLDHLYD
jgi:hypothetical protein